MSELTADKLNIGALRKPLLHRLQPLLLPPTNNRDSDSRGAQLTNNTSRIRRDGQRKREREKKKSNCTQAQHLTTTAPPGDNKSGNKARNSRGCFLVSNVAASEQPALCMRAVCPRRLANSPTHIAHATWKRERERDTHTQIEGERRPPARSAR